MDFERLLPILLGASVAAFISIMLFVARRIDKNEHFEIQVKRVNLLDADDVRLQASFLNATRATQIVKDLTIVYRDCSKISIVVDQLADPFIVRGGKKDRMDVDAEGHSRLRVNPGSGCSCYYSFQKKGDLQLSGNGKFYVRYKSDDDRCYYAQFDPMSPHGQPLHFYKRRWEK